MPNLACPRWLSSKAHATTSHGIKRLDYRGTATLHTIQPLLRSEYDSSIAARSHIPTHLPQAASEQLAHANARASPIRGATATSRTQSFGLNENLVLYRPRQRHVGVVHGTVAVAAAAVGPTPSGTVLNGLQRGGLVLSRCVDFSFPSGRAVRRERQ